MTFIKSENMRIGVFLCHCGTNIAGVLDMKSLSDYAGKLPGVVLSAPNIYTCSVNRINAMFVFQYVAGYA